MDGSSSTYVTPTSPEPSCVASRMRCASPPDRVGGRARQRQVVRGRRRSGSRGGRWISLTHFAGDLRGRALRVLRPLIHAARLAYGGHVAHVRRWTRPSTVTASTSGLQTPPVARSGRAPRACTTRSTRVIWTANRFRRAGASACAPRLRSRWSTRAGDPSGCGTRRCTLKSRPYRMASLDVVLGQALPWASPWSKPISSAETLEHVAVVLAGDPLAMPHGSMALVGQRLVRVGR